MALSSSHLQRVSNHIAPTSKDAPHNFYLEHSLDCPNSATASSFVVKAQNMDTATAAPIWQSNDARNFPSDVRLLIWLTSMLLVMSMFVACYFACPTSRRVAVLPDPDPSVTFTIAIPTPAPVDAALEFASALHSQNERVMQTLIVEKFHPPSSFLHCSRPYDTASHDCLCHQAQQAVELCSICLEPFVIGDDVGISKVQACGHCFHVTCALEYLVQPSQSPCCRHNHFDNSGSVVKSKHSPIIEIGTAQ